MKKLKNLLKGFTLVELIIVIAIVAILGVAAFLVVTKWIGKSRDARRLSDVGTMVRSVTLYKSENGNVPMPSGSISTGTIETPDGEEDFSYVGTFGKETVGQLDNLQVVPTDPMIEGKEYQYGVSDNKKEFEVGVTLEGDEESAFMNSVFALREIAKVDGNFEPKTVILSGNILKVIPSLLFVTTGSDIKNVGGSEVNFIVDEGYNKPYTIYGEGENLDTQDESLARAVRNNYASFDGVNLSGGTLTEVLEGIRDISGGEPEMKEIASFVKSNGFLAGYSDEEIDNGVDEVLSGYKFEAPKVGVKINYKGCGNLSHGGKKTFYSEESVAYGNSCEDVKKVFECSDGVWKDGESDGDTGTYKYSMCSVEGAVDCSTNSSYSYNSHTYDIVEIPHGSTESTTSSEVNENNGTFTYELSTTCNNGLYINESEIGPTLVDCNGGYSRDGNSCILSDNGNKFSYNNGARLYNSSSVYWYGNYSDNGNPNGTCYNGPGWNSIYTISWGDSLTFDDYYSSCKPNPVIGKRDNNPWFYVHWSGDSKYINLFKVKQACSDGSVRYMQFEYSDDPNCYNNPLNFSYKGTTNTPNFVSDCQSSYIEAETNRGTNVFCVRYRGFKSNWDNWLEISGIKAF